MRKPKRRRTAAEKRARRERKEKYVTIFINGKQKRVPRPPMIEGMPVNEVGRIPAREEMRQHLIDTIDRHQCDVKHSLERKGSPYSLVLTKTSGSFERSVKRFEANHRLLNALPIAGQCSRTDRQGDGSRFLEDRRQKRRSHLVSGAARRPSGRSASPRRPCRWRPWERRTWRRCLVGREFPPGCCCRALGPVGKANGRRIIGASRKTLFGTTFRLV